MKKKQIKRPVPLLVDDRGYVLYANPNATYDMGCRRNFTPAQCFKHWGRGYFCKHGELGRYFSERRKTRAAKIRKAVRDHQKGLPIEFVVMGDTPGYIEIGYADLTGVSFPKRLKNTRVDMYIQCCDFNGEELVLPDNLESIRIDDLTTAKDGICVVIGKHTKINWEE
jgi:hypothetical protein